MASPPHDGPAAIYVYLLPDNCWDKASTPPVTLNWEKSDFFWLSCSVFDWQLTLTHI